jgi:aminoglycoside 2'-N-acetyltransferase I
MSEADLCIEVKDGQELSDEEREDIVALCSRAFGASYQPYMDSFSGPTHILGFLHGELVSHALWVERLLQVEDDPPLRTAYVEAVATEEKYRHRGFASAIMKRLTEEVADYELAGLCTGFPEFYQHLGWQIWEGPLFIRTQEDMIHVPADVVMVFSLPNSPALDINAPLSAEWREGDPW